MGQEQAAWRAGPLHAGRVREGTTVTDTAAVAIREGEEKRVEHAHACLHTLRYADARKIHMEKCFHTMLAQLTVRVRDQVHMRKRTPG